MASPFKFFRKYSGGMMIVMVILSMLLFTLTDLFSDPGRNLWLLGLLLGGTVFGIAGVGQGRWLQWGLGGAALGVLLGVILPGFVEGQGALNTSLGVITPEEMQEMQVHRQLANQFIYGATEASFGPNTGRFAPLFGFGDGGPRDVLFGKLLRAEADELGIMVDSRMVGDYLKRVTSDKLTDANYVKVRSGMSYKGRELQEETLQDVLSQEIKARMAYQLLRTRTTTLPPGPEVYWEYFRRLNVRQQIVTTALDPHDFVDQVPDPSDSEVEAMFTEFKKKFPNQIEPGSPGFRMPFQAKIAMVELNTKAVEAELAEVTEDEIKAYYDENKETPMIRTPVMPDFPKPETTEKAAEKPGEKTDDKKAEKPENSDSSPDSKKDDSKKADDKKPAAVESKEKAAPPAKPPAADKSPEKPAAPAKDKKTEAPNEPVTEEPASKTPEEPKVEESATEDEKAEEDAFSIEVADDSPATPDADETPTDDDSAKPESPASDKAADSDTPNIQPALTIPEIPAGPQDSTTPPKAPEIQYEYRKLDDTLKQEIREELTRERVSNIVEEKLKGARKLMETLASERASHRFSLMESEGDKYGFDNPKQQEALRDLRESMQTFDAELDARLKAYADANGFSYVETPLLGARELIDSEEYLIGRATEPVANPMMAAQSPTVASVLYRSFTDDEQNNDAQTYFVRTAERASTSQDGSMSHYIYWATDFSLSHIPTLDEPGMQDKVALAIKRRSAIELLKKRGQELAQVVRDALAQEGDARQDMAAALKDQTATGDDSSAPLAVRQSQPFTWLRTSTASPMNFQQQQASLSPISFNDTIGGTLEMAGDEFMKTVFDEMEDEEVRVVPNADFSKYYVVHVTNRFPTPEIGEESLRERFATTGQKFSFRDSPILSVMQQQLDGPASIEWETSLWKKYGVDLNADPDEDE